MSFEHLARAELAGMFPELLLCGHLIDRAGMPHVVGELGREGMGEVAIEEWMAASPVYTRRTMRALGIDGDGVAEIFKCLQHDIGAPPEFLDFRFTVHDHDHGEFQLAHCGALMDVEPMGEDYVRTMCHDIEDPTFDATAGAVNPRAQIRPVHRPPRVPADREPHCAWTVSIAEEHEALSVPDAAVEVGRSEAARFTLSTGPVEDDGAAGYAGEVQADVDWSSFSRALLLRLADEISLQCHLLALGFHRALRRRLSGDRAGELLGRQLTGAGGLASRRLCRALGLAPSAGSVPQVLAVHPALNPAGYVGFSMEGEDLIRLQREAPGVRDAGWARLLHEDLSPWRAIVQGISPTLDVVAHRGDRAVRRLRVIDTGEPQPEAEGVQLAALSTGADFAFDGRRPLLPISPA